MNIVIKELSTKSSIHSLTQLFKNLYYLFLQISINTLKECHLCLKKKLLHSSMLYSKKFKNSFRSSHQSPTSPNALPKILKKKWPRYHHLYLEDRQRFRKKKSPRHKIFHRGNPGWRGRTWKKCQWIESGKYSKLGQKNTSLMHQLT